MSDDTEPTKPETARLFFALWPDAPTCARLDEAGRRLHEICGGRRTRAETIHLTLAFLGDVDLARIDELLLLAGEIQAPAFAFRLTHSGWWQHNRIAWIAPDETPLELARLVDGLKQRLGSAGFRLEARPFVPHVTLLRKANCNKEVLPSEVIEWRAGDFVLVRSVLSERGAAYEVIGHWPLLHGNNDKLREN
ncbi:MAG: RNA 2',3'-cyclic phosphodiesterase [Sulfuricella sp.]|nr:RNA 2',3'-cyclic phosphodiesterase [Sulfuricella sp.]